MCYLYMYQCIEGFQKYIVFKNLIIENLDMNDKCVIYFNEILEKYCVLYQLLCCNICLVIEYKMCFEVQFIDVVQMKIIDVLFNNIDVILEF